MKWIESVFKYCLYCSWGTKGTVHL